MQKTIENFQMVKRDKLKDFGQVLKGALEYMTGSIGEELKFNMVLTINAQSRKNFRAGCGIILVSTGFSCGWNWLNWLQSL